MVLDSSTHQAFINRILRFFQFFSHNLVANNSFNLAYIGYSYLDTPNKSKFEGIRNQI